MDLDIEQSRKLYDMDMVFSTQHVIERCVQRKIDEKDICDAVFSGTIIEQYPEDYPWPSCLIVGTTSTGKILHTVIGSNGEAGKIITAYWPDEDKWSSDFKIRREK